MGEPQHDPRRTPAEHLPPLWIRARDSQGRPIDPRVIAEAERLWPWAYQLVRQELHDPACAAQLVERVALKDSNRLHDEPSVKRNLPGYFAAAFRNQVREQFRKENRVTYEGLLRELERNHHLTAPDWEAAMVWELCLQILIDQLPDQCRHMLNFRILGFSWEEIGLVFHLSGKQARSQFYYELAKVRAKLLNGKAKGAGHSEESD